MEVTLRINNLGSFIIDRGGEAIGGVVMIPSPRVTLWNSHSSLSFNELRDLMKEAEDYYNRHEIVGVPS